MFKEFQAATQKLKQNLNLNLNRAIIEHLNLTPKLGFKWVCVWNESCRILNFLQLPYSKIFKFQWAEVAGHLAGALRCSCKLATRCRPSVGRRATRHDDGNAERSPGLTRALPRCFEDKPPPLLTLPSLCKKRFIVTGIISLKWRIYGPLSRH